MRITEATWLPSRREANKPRAGAFKKAGGAFRYVKEFRVPAEAPKVAPHIPAMRAVLAPLLHVSSDRIAIKATTAERLGSIGRGEGIVAFAVALVER